MKKPSRISKIIISTLICVGAFYVTEANSIDSDDKHINNLQPSHPQLHTKTNGFNTMYGMSYGIDICGDSKFGQLYRNAIIAKVEACPFSEDAKKEFYIAAAQTLDKLPA